jgi:6-pyruvoyl-tetrahydropterin synthase
MTISLSITGELDEQGILGGLDFGSVKKVFRHYIDTNYDHRLLLNKDDPWASLTRAGHYPDDVDEKLPGLVTCEGDPTTERIALWIAEWAEAQFKGSSGIDAVFVEVKETDTNGADCAIHIEE